MVFSDRRFTDLLAFGLKELSHLGLRVTFSIWKEGCSKKFRLAKRGIQPKSSQRRNLWFEASASNPTAAQLTHANLTLRFYSSINYESGHEPSANPRGMKMSRTSRAALVRVEVAESMVPKPLIAAFADEFDPVTATAALGKCQVNIFGTQGNFALTE